MGELPKIISGDDHVLEVYTDDCRMVEGSPEAPLPLIVSGAASKYRQLHPAFMQRQNERYPQLTNLWSRGQVWGFAHVQIVDDDMTVLASGAMTGGAGAEASESTKPGSSPSSWLSVASTSRLDPQPAASAVLNTTRPRGSRRKRRPMT